MGFLQKEDTAHHSLVCPLSSGLMANRRERNEANTEWLALHIAICDSKAKDFVVYTCHIVLLRYYTNYFS